MRLNVISSLGLGLVLLTGCGGDSSGDSPEKPSSTPSKSRTIDVTLQAEVLHQNPMPEVNNLGISTLQQVDQINYAHYLKTHPYGLRVTDEFGLRVISEDIDITSEYSFSFESIGDAEIDLYQINSPGVGLEYMVEGTTYVSSNETSTIIELSNKESSYLTVSEHDAIESVHLVANNESSDQIQLMYNDDGYYMGYFIDSATLHVKTEIGKVISMEVQAEANQHLSFRLELSHDSSFGFEIIENWDEPIDSVIVDPNSKDIFLDGLQFFYTEFEHALTDTQFSGRPLATETPDGYVIDPFLPIQDGTKISDLQFEKVKVLDGSLLLFINSLSLPSGQIVIDPVNNEVSVTDEQGLSEHFSYEEFISLYGDIVLLDTGVWFQFYSDAFTIVQFDFLPRLTK